MNVREKTCLIIRKGPDFLVGTILYSTDLRWSISPWDAWQTRSREQAERVAGKTGGTLWLFIPILGQLRRARWNKS